jgi:membrane protease YdiL (CAAX protease family)
LAALTAVVGLWPAVLLSSINFGIGHSYQGLKGILKTGLVGLVMALIVTSSGSLFVAILLHAIIDLAQGNMLYRVVNFDEATPALQASTG